MERIHYAGGEALTGTAIARNLLRYAGILAENEMAIPVEIPVRLADGSLGRVTLLIGPSSQLMSEPEVSAFAEIDDDETIRRLQDAADKLGPLKVKPYDTVPTDSIEEFGESPFSNTEWDAKAGKERPRR